MNQKEKDALQKAINYFGTQQKLADAIGISQSLISHMMVMQEYKKINPELALRIEKATNKSIKKEELTPWFCWK